MVTYPTDWAPMQLRDIGYIQMCRRIFQSQTKTYGAIPFYKISTFGGKADAYISQELYEKYKLLYPYPEKGDVLISAAGTIGKTVIFDGKDSYFQDSNIVWLKVDKEVIDRKFLWWFYRSFPWDALEGTTIQRLYNSIILDTEIHLPEKPEQEEIARTLSLFDTYIDDLAELIEKKKGIRDGALEDLISGKTRIVGFSGERKEFSINDITREVITGGTPSTSRREYYGGNIPWLASAEIHQKRITKPTTYITELGLQNSSAKIAPEKSVLIALAGQGKTRGTAAYLTKPMALNQSLAALVTNEKCNSEFLYYLIESMYSSLRELSSGDGGRGGLNKKLIKGVLVTIPVDVDEQEAIANTLLAIDEEIRDLETEREKMIQIREGAMNDLLTGRVRLTK